jgi:hypothetical protein
MTGSPVRALDDWRGETLARVWALVRRPTWPWLPEIQTALLGARNGARSPTDSSRSQPDLDLAKTA